MTLDIRHLGPDDERVLRHVAAGVFDHEVDPALASEFLRDPRHHLVVAIEDGSVVGFASVKGALCDKVAQPHTAPIVTFVLPTGVMVSMRASRAVQSEDRGMISASEDWLHQ